MADSRLHTVSLGCIVAEYWGEDILLPQALLPTSHGLEMCHRYRLSGVRGEAKRGFPSIFNVGLPAFQRALSSTRREAARVQAFFALLEICEDTTLLNRGGYPGWRFARMQSRRFLQNGGVTCRGWKTLAEDIHCAFVARNLTAGGVADLLAATLFVNDMHQTL
jgi:triphosphoribosyl-dephospho-CoA synthase